MKPALIFRLLPLILLGLALLGFMLLLMSRPVQPPIEVAERAWLVDIEQIRPQTLSPQLRLYGHIGSPRAASLSAAFEADVARVPAEEGRCVQSGDILLILDDRELLLRIRQHEADVEDLLAQLSALGSSHERDREALRREQALLDLAGRAVDRQKDLMSRQLGSAAALEEAQRGLEQQALAVANRRLAVEDFPAREQQLQARLERARAMLDLARLDLERATVRAPFGGRIHRVHVAPGDRIQAGDPLVAVHDMEALEVRAAIPARYLPQLRASLEQGRAATGTGWIDGLEVPLRLSRLAGEARSAGAGVDGLFKLGDGPVDLPLGRFISLRLSLPERDGLVALPHEALYGLDRIYRLEDGRMRMIQVERVGEWLDGNGQEFILVHSPALNTGDAIIVTRLPNAMDGLRVRAVVDTE